VLWETGDPWSVEEVEVDEPRAGEALVRVVASGLCHSDDHFRTGDMPTSAIPLVGGHEGAGIVERVGPGVSALAPGDHVVSTFLPSCGTCRWCSSGRQNLCDLGAVIKFGRMLDGTSRLRARGQELGALSMIGTFGAHMVASEHSLVKIDQDIPLELACLLGCGVTTGWGSAVNTGQVQQGDTVVIVGCGGIGGGAIQGARLAGAAQIVAVDIAGGKRPALERLGATHFADSMHAARSLVEEITHGVMADVAILSVGVVHGDMIGELVSLVRKAGTAVLTGIAPWDETRVTMPLLEMTLFQKSLRGSLFGEANPRADIPRLARLYRAGKLQLEDFVTQEYKLSEINRAYRDMLEGRNIRGVIRHEH
jgi:S-(hydroxymethyl)glutathione dehydrogenase/alcohol dehydrogenase